MTDAKTTPQKKLTYIKLPMLGAKVYTALKWIAVIGLPAFATLYFGLEHIWGWGHTTQVLGTISAIETFLGIVLGLSTASYNSSDTKFAGEIHLAADAGGAVLNKLIFNADPDVLAANKSVIMKVQNVAAGTPPEAPAETTTPVTTPTPANPGTTPPSQ